MLNKVNKIYIYFVIIVVLISVVGIFWDSIWSSGNTGNIVISYLPENTVIFLDNQEIKRINRAEENINLKRLESGIHSILISKDAFWPWLKEVEVVSGETEILSPFFVPSNTSGLIVGREDLEYEDLIAKINAINLPTFENKKISPDKSIAIWVDGSTLFAEWLLGEDLRPDYFCNDLGCHNVVVPLGVGGEIRNVDFYKERNDVFIVAFGNGVFALEIDTRGTQNFQPIIEGTSPLFILNDESSIYTLDNDVLMQVAL
jgi:hypothetical protein